MKKLIIICLLALTYTSTYAQEPTKQETMDWIASKLIKYRTISVSNLKYEKNKITYDFNNGMLVKDILYLENVSDYDFNGQQWLIKGKSIGATYYSDGSFLMNVDIVSINEGDSRGSFDISLEAGLKERFMKALDLLIKYNTAKSPNEKF